MRLIPDDDQKLLETSVRQFVSEHSPVSRVRALRDARSEEGFSRELWRQMAELGWVGATLPERYGGSELPFRHMASLLYETGRTLVPEPFVSTVLLGAGVLAESGDEARADTWLPRVASGDAFIALAAEERHTRGDVARTALAARRERGGWVLSGTKHDVLDGAVADAWLVVARTAGEPGSDAGLTLLWVDRDTDGVSAQAQQRIDARGAATLTFDDVLLPELAVVGARDEAAGVLGPALDRAVIALSSEMLGGAERVFDDTLSYLKEREQFGVTIGSFQALQHRAARLFIELTLARSAVAGAAAAVDEAPERVARLASLAKARMSEVYVQVCNEAVQMHGGIGVTDEHHVGFFLKRARVAAATLGDSAHHRRRWAQLAGY